jgi:hypothetical protein
MQSRRRALDVLPERFGICRLDPDASIPNWAQAAPFFSITRTEEELSVVCREHVIPQQTWYEKGWRCLKVQGPLDFSETGILYSLTKPLAREDISVFALSTYHTDYLLVREKDLPKTIEALSREGFLLKYK